MRFFVNLSKDLSLKIPNHNTFPAKFLKQTISETIFLEPVIESEVLRIIGRLKDGSAGWDGLQTKTFKAVKHILLEPLTHVLNLSLLNGHFPQELKMANVIPIFKSGDAQVFTNYRPVSILPVISKIFERIMYIR